MGGGWAGGERDAFARAKDGHQVAGWWLFQKGYLIRIREVGVFSNPLGLHQSDLIPFGWLVVGQIVKEMPSLARFLRVRHSCGGWTGGERDVFARAKDGHRVAGWWCVLKC